MDRCVWLILNFFCCKHRCKINEVTLSIWCCFGKILLAILIAFLIFAGMFIMDSLGLLITFLWFKIKGLDMKSVICGINFIDYKMPKDENTFWTCFIPAIPFLILLIILLILCLFIINGPCRDLYLRCLELDTIYQKEHDIIYLEVNTSDQITENIINIDVDTFYQKEYDNIIDLEVSTSDQII